jgi:hypothetical protein
MTPHQDREYSILRDFGWEYSHTETDGSIFMDRWDRTADASFRLETAVLPPDGKWYRLPTLQANAAISHAGEDSRSQD